MALTPAMEDYLEAVLIMKQRTVMSDAWMSQSSWA